MKNRKVRDETFLVIFLKKGTYVRTSALIYVFILCMCAVLVWFYNHQAYDSLSRRGRPLEWDPPLREGNISAVVGLVTRLLPQHAGQFLFEIDRSLGPEDKDTFLLLSFEDKLIVKGTSAIALSMGVHYYLKYYCNAHVSWSGNQLRIPEPMPKVVTSVIVTTQDKYRHYQNVCTVSYSMLWWNWSRWEKEIDWMALNGINLPLAFTAQEAIWRKVYLGYGFTDSEINEFFSGPSFLAWNRMGNLQAFGGPLSEAWHKQRVALQKLILQRMRDFGMHPVLPAFSGRVLPAFQRIFPNSSVRENEPWMSFPPPFCCTTLLDPLDPLFVEVGAKFLSEYEKEFGVDHFYSVDLFNEMTPPSSDPTYLRNCGKAVYQSLAKVDDEAIWIMQGWIFVNEPWFWLQPQAKALLTSVPLGRMIVLDLEAEFNPQYSNYNSFYGQPFIWSIIHNYGAVHGLFGSLNAINQGPFKGRSYPQSSMIGTGITPEGIERNDVVYDLMNEMAWRSMPVDNMDTWISNYAFRRYGKINQNITTAWIHLKESVYNVASKMKNHGEYVFSSRPSLSLAPNIWYDPQDVFTAMNLLIQQQLDPDLAKQETFMYDLTDITRQVFQLLFDSFYLQLSKAYTDKDMEKISEIGEKMMALFDEMDGLLLSNSHFSLDSFMKTVTSWATTPQEIALYEWNLRNQISIWGPNAQIIDYARKQLGGVVSSYFKPRWDLFLTTLQSTVTRGFPFNQSAYNNLVFNFVEEPFTYTVSAKEKHNIKDNPWDSARRFFQVFKKEMSYVQAKFVPRRNSTWVMTIE